MCCFFDDYDDFVFDVVFGLGDEFGCCFLVYFFVEFG